MDLEIKKYNRMENVLNKINKDFISLPANAKKRNNIILEQATTLITNLMKEKDVLFRNMYERKFYGGSYYDGIKVGKPEEYDLDYVLNLPLITEPVVVAAEHKPGFVHVQIKEYMKLLKREEASKFSKLDTLMDKCNYLSTFEVLKWIERIITLAFKELENVPDKGHKIEVKLDEKQTILVYATLSKAFPAFTLKLKDAEGTMNMDIDLVPCFQFQGKDKWLSEKDGYRPNPFPKRNKFLVVPKKPHGMDESYTLERYWRLSFQEQEREIIKGQEFKSMKPTIRMLKRLRDQQNHAKIASYYIKTIFLWEVDKQPVEFWENPSSYVFMMMLKKYAEMVQNKRIPYYWNERYNLIGHVKDVTITAIGNTLRNLIDDIDRNINFDPFLVAKYIIGHDNMQILRCDVNLGKRHVRKLQINQCLFNYSPPSSSSVFSEPETPSSVISLSENEKVRKLLDEGFLQQVAEHIARHLEPKWRDAEKCQSGALNLADEGNGQKPWEKKGEVMQSLDSMHVKVDKMVGMITDLTNTCGSLTERVSSLESSYAELRQENGRLRSELRRANADKEEPRSDGNPFDDLLSGFVRISCEKLLEK